jgi:NADH-quinone oxidoreductase subunit G
VAETKQETKPKAAAAPAVPEAAPKAPESVTISVNGRDLTVPPGYPVIQAALDHKIHIPHFCYHPDLGIDGNCRMCLGELEGAPKLVATCTLRAAAGMKVRTDTPRVREAVRGVLEFILINHPIDCPICDQAGECGLQDFYATYGLYGSRVRLEDKVRKRKVIDLGPMIVLDTERCVLCSRCIRFSDKVDGTHEIRFKQRGDHTEITTFEDQPLVSGYAGNLADICPVGALTSKDFRFKMRVWFLKSAPSVCDVCSNGCSMRIDHQGNRIHRQVPRRNSAVNASWMCDEGRLSYKRVGAPTRLQVPVLGDRGGKRTPIPWEKALDLAARRIREAREPAGQILAVATPAVTTEELYLFGKFARTVLRTPHIDFRVSSTNEQPSESEDGILRRKDRFPNSTGAALLGLTPGGLGAAAEGSASSVAAGAGESTGLAGAASRPFKLVYVLAADRLAEADHLPAIRSILERAGIVIAHAAHDTELLDLCDLVFPVTMNAERRGTLVNHSGRVQRIEPAVAAPGEAEPDGRVLTFIAEKLEEPLGVYDPAAVFAEMAARVPAFHGLTFNQLGDLGRQANGIEAVPPRVTEIAVAPQLVG